MLDTRLIEMHIQDAEGILSQLTTAAARLGAAIEEDLMTKRQLSEANKALSAAESEIVMEAEYASQDKAGPLAGIAKTSKAYGFALDALLTKERANGSSVGFYAREVRRLEAVADNAAIEREQATVQFSAIRHAADLMAAILKAASL